MHSLCGPCQVTSSRKGPHLREKGIEEHDSGGSLQPSYSKFLNRY